MARKIIFLVRKDLMVIVSFYVEIKLTWIYLEWCPCWLQFLVGQKGYFFRKHHLKSQPGVFWKLRLRLTYLHSLPSGVL